MKLLRNAVWTATMVAAAGYANAANINFSATYGLSAAEAAETSFLSSAKNFRTETFDGTDFDDIKADGSTVSSVPAPFVTENQSGSGDQDSWVYAATTFGTKVGTFTMTTPNTPNNNNNVVNDHLMIEDSDTGEFGRSGTGNWLDSNDADSMTWSLGTIGYSYDAFGFFISDANDQGATLRLEFEDGSSLDKDLTIKGPATGDGTQPNGNIAYVQLFSDQLFTNASVIFNNGSGNADGFGIDDVTLARVPEPGTLALLGLGLIGLAMKRRNS